MPLRPSAGAGKGNPSDPAEGLTGANRRQESGGATMASIKPKTLKDGTVCYLITVSLGRDKDTGKQIVKSTQYTPKAKAPSKIEKEVNAYAIDFEEKLKNGDIVSGDKITVNEFVKIWEKNWLPEKTPAVRENYMDKLNLHVLPVIGHMKITAVRATHIDSIIQTAKDNGKAPATIRDLFTVINSVFKYAFKKQYIRENPCIRCDDRPPVKAKTGKDIQFFTEDQARRFIRDALTMEYSMQYGQRGRKSKQTGKTYTVKAYTVKKSVSLMWRIYFMMAIWGTFRRGEMCALTWNDINEKRQIIDIEKAAAMTKSEQYLKGPKTDAGIREVTMPEEIFSLLREWKREQFELCMKLGSAWMGHRNGLKDDGKTPDSFDENTIFIQTDNGLPLHLSTPNHKFHEICDLYNATREKETDKLPRIRLHDLRHTGATLLLGKKTDIETVSHRLGHAKASVTLDIYGHALPENDQQAAETMAAMF